MNRITLDAITRQADAMAVDVFEIGLYKPAVDGRANEPEMLPRTWDKATLLKSVGWLKYQNSQGRNIYIRPKGEHALSLVDDLNAGGSGTDEVGRFSAGDHRGDVARQLPGVAESWPRPSQSGIHRSGPCAGRAIRWRSRCRRLATLREACGSDEQKAEVQLEWSVPVRRLVEANGQPYPQRHSLRRRRCRRASR